MPPRPSFRLALAGTLLFGAVTQTHAAAGDLDTSFGNNGWVETEVLPDRVPPNDAAYDAIEQPDGKLVVAGYTQIDGVMKALLTRYHGDGSPDTSFGTDGKVVLEAGNGSDAINALVQQPDGKLVVTGRTVDDTQHHRFFIARVHGDGTLDNSFGSNGITTTAIGSGNSIPYDVILQGDGKLVAAGYATGAAGTDFALVRYNPDGTLDSGFANGGIAQHNLAGSDGQDDIQALALQSDGKLVAVGTANVSGNRNFALARFNTDGTLDSGFSDDGKVITDIKGDTDIARALTIQSDGKLVVAGDARDPGDSGRTKMAVARYLTDGSLDSSFGQAGKQLILIGTSGFSRGYDVIALPDGKLVAAAQGSFGSTTFDAALVQLNADGSLDTSFDGDGYANAPHLNSDVPAALLRQADGKLIIAGYTNTTPGNTGIDLMLSRFNPDGTLDTGFNSTGILTTNPGTLGSRAFLRGIAQQPDGKLIAAGYADAGQDQDAVTVRYTSDGTLDTGFGNSGITQTDLGSYEYIQDVLVQDDGKIVSAGRGNGGSANSLLLRHNTDGSADAGFGTNGVSTTSLSSAYEYANAAIQQDDGKLVVVGYSYNATDRHSESVVSRYLPDGTLDTSFSADGIVKPNLDSTNNYFHAITQQNDGKLIAAGQTGNSGAQQFTLARFNTDGSPDTSFNTNGSVIMAAGSGNAAARDLAVLEDGKILVAVQTIGDTSLRDFGLLRFNADGSLDTSFANGGIVMADFAAGNDTPHDLLVQPDGKVLLTGVAVTPESGNQIALARFNPDGSPDIYFGQGGKRLLDIGAGAYEAIVQDDGNIVVGGYTSSPVKFLLARIMGNGMDSDGDTVPDDFDAFPNHAAAARDDDNDGLPDAWNSGCDATCQTDSGLTLDPYPNDSDNDGATNDNDAFPNDPHETTDTDGDNVGDNADAFPDNPDAATDSDGDGFPEDCSNDCGGLTPDPSPNDVDNDGLVDAEDNVDGDNNPPEVTAPADIQLIASGDLTTVDLGMASASDVVDGDIATVTPDSENGATTVELAPGRHLITWSATDDAGNTGSDTQTVDITPLARFSSTSQTAGDGSTVTLTVELNGDAVSYPVRIPVVIDVSSTANGDDHDAVEHVIEILEDSNPANTGTYEFVATDDGLTGEADETVIFNLVAENSLDVLENAALDDNVKQHTVTITELNVAPLISTVTLSDGTSQTVLTGSEIEAHTLIRKDRDITLTAGLTDANPEDSHTYSWMINGELQAATFDTLTLNPMDYEPGEYTLSVQAVDDANPPEYSNTLEATLTLKNPAPAPAAAPSSSGGGGALHWLWLFAGLLLTPRLRSKHG